MTSWEIHAKSLAHAPLPQEQQPQIEMTTDPLAIDYKNTDYPGDAHRIGKK